MKWHLEVNGKSYHSQHEVRRVVGRAVKEGVLTEHPGCEYSRRERAVAAALGVQLVAGPEVTVEVVEGECRG